MKTITALALAIAVFIPATITAQAAPRPNRIAVSYVPPKNPAYQAIYERLRAVRFLERFQELLRPFELPRTVLIKLDSCNGEADAWYEDYVDHDLLRIRRRDLEDRSGAGDGRGRRADRRAGGADLRHRAA